MDINRNNGRSALGTVLNKEQNIRIIEKHIYDMTIKLCEQNDDINETYRRNIYQIIGDIMNGSKLKDILSHIKQGKIGWKHNAYNEITMKQKEQDEFILNPFEVEEGVLECKCGSKRVFSYSRQSRGADEPMSTYAQCMACKARWVYSG